MKKRNPWNRVESQVYSLSSVDENGKVNMNIVTYATPITMSPKMYVIAIYRETQTHKNIFGNKKQKYFLLQALCEAQMSLIRVLGKKSGIKYDKVKFLEKQSLDIFKVNIEKDDYKKEGDKNIKIKSTELKYLKESAFVLLCKIEKYIEVDDHDLVIVKIEKTILNNHDKKMLDTEDLIENKIIL